MITTTNVILLEKRKTKGNYKTIFLKNLILHYVVKCQFQKLFNIHLWNLVLISIILALKKNPNKQNFQPFYHPFYSNHSNIFLDSCNLSIAPLDINSLMFCLFFLKIAWIWKRIYNDVLDDAIHYQWLDIHNKFKCIFTCSQSQMNEFTTKAISLSYC